MNHSLTSKERYFLEKISQWFSQNQRPLPFRGTKDPYKIWISEIMLQQTRVGAVVSKIENKFDRFIKKFPDIYHLAKSDLKEVMEIWAGLGYYNRAINLHKTAQIIVEQYQGTFPEEYSLLIQLPGIGDYTASAILSIAFEKPFAVFDGNVKRLTYRFFFKEFQNQTEKNVKHFLNEMIKNSKIQPSILNQGMMEFGSLICIYKFPKCKDCVISHHCDVKNFPKELILNIPPKKEKQKKDLHLHVFIIKNNNKILIIKNQSFILKHHYFFPYYIIEESQNPPFTENSLFIQEPKANYIGEIKHHIMHYNIYAKIFLIERYKNQFTFNSNDKIESKWIDLNETKKFLFTSFSQKILNLLSQNYLLF